MSDAGLFLGVDGGGTKTRFALMDADRRIVADAQFGTTYHPEVGLDGVRSVLERGIAKVLADSGAKAARISWAFFGFPGFGEDPAATPALTAMPAPILRHDRYTVDNDMVCGWAGSLAAADGINIVAGTGSIGYGQRGKVAARAGGWSETFGDEGSAYWIAMQGLNAYSRMSDGRQPKGPLHALVNETLGLKNDLDLCAYVNGASARSRGELAQLSQLVSKAAALGDTASIDIFRRAGAELAQIADALRRQLGFPAGETVNVSYSGGAFGAGDLLLKPFEAALKTASADFTVSRPLHEPHYGAALYAEKLWRAARG